MNKVIIGIHGLGNKPPKDILEKWWKQSLEDGLNGLGKKYPLPEFELVYWADAVYDKPLNPDVKDKTDPAYIEEVYTRPQKIIFPRLYSFRLKIKEHLIKLIKKVALNEDLNVKFPQLAELVVQRYFHELEKYFNGSPGDADSPEIKEIIRDRAIGVLKKYRDYDIFLIGHSMGSIIGYEVLLSMIPEIRIHTFVSMGSPLGFPFVVGKLKSRLDPEQDGNIILRTPSSVWNKWYNFTDKEDLIALNQRLSGIFKKNDKGVRPIDIHVKNTYMINGRRNHHKSYGYLRTRAFSRVLSIFIEEKRIGLLKKFSRFFDPIS